MRLVVRCIYYMTVTPSCDVIELDHETWIKFLHSESMRDTDEKQPEKKVIITNEQYEAFKAEVRKELASMMENGKPVYSKVELENEMRSVSNREVEWAIGDKMSPKDYAEFISQ